MIVAIHQPNFAPWLGYFAKIAKSDVFVFLDHVGFAKNGWTNRVRIKTPKGPSWLTVPVRTSGRLGQPIAVVATNEKIDWRKKMAASLHANYARARYAGAVLPRIASIIAASPPHLCSLNISLITAASSWLGLEPRFVRSSQLQVSGTKTELLVDICRKVDACVYLSGDGADYQKDELFAKADIRTTRNDFRHPEYPQLWDGFLPGLSVVDALCNLGFDETRELLIAQPTLS